MNSPSPSPGPSAGSGSVTAETVAAEPGDQAGRWLDRSWHVLVVVLVVVGAVRAIAPGSGAQPCLLAVVLLGLDVVGLATGAWPDFATTSRRSSQRADRLGRGLDAAGLVAAGVAVAAYPDAFVWLAFPVGLVVFHRLSVVASLLAGVVMTAGCLAALARVAPLAAPRVLGPVIGLAVAAAGATAIRTLQAEAARRWQLVVELRETRQLVAQREHEAGILEERQRLARDIHDTVAQGLSSILMLTEAVQRELVDPPQQVADNLARLDDVAREDLAATRRLIDDLAPVDLERFDLAHALRRRAERVRASSGVPVELDLAGLPHLSRELDVAILRIVGQAMDNAISHADPDRIRVSVATAGDRLLVDVHDDGSGFDPATDGGRGISGMRTRARLLGGTLAIESHPDGGTVVAADLPLDPAQPKPPPTSPPTSPPQAPPPTSRSTPPSSGGARTSP